MSLSSSIRLKSLLLLAVVAWLFSFRAYHVLTTHTEGHAHEHCGHTHHTDHRGDMASGEDHCEICDLLALPFTEAEAPYVPCGSFPVNASEYSFLISSKGILFPFAFDGRGPPVMG